VLFEGALHLLGMSNGRIGVIGGPDVFDLFLDRYDIQRALTALDGMAEITAALPPVGVMRSGVNAAGNAIVYWHIQNDKESIVEALVSSQRAKLAYDDRLAATDE
jgi:hypothetical protein